MEPEDKFFCAVRRYLEMSASRMCTPTSFDILETSSGLNPLRDNLCAGMPASNKASVAARISSFSACRSRSCINDTPPPRASLARLIARCRSLQNPFGVTNIKQGLGSAHFVRPSLSWNRGGLLLRMGFF